MKAVRVERMIGAALLLGVVLFAVLIGWSTLATLPHTLECRGIRDSYLAASSRAEQATFEARFNQAGCTGSLLNTFLPAS